MSDLALELEKLIEEKKQQSNDVRQQLDFLKKAQDSGLIKKPEFNLASVVNVATAM
ncbi:hypothetical protein [Alteromonas naphthalenivorans]|uniref:Uncharacterized protein n=1 Tax=Alteromonas naphthalenivorans TaxID=715451 RepID=F5Z6X5_ALTNA|nr:hypothetical protein [Alteromonas naphthalenivorans]AEF05638.1 hypothetical protein ambt_20735 [Alteromonas naphthalenivorans]